MRLQELGHERLRRPALKILDGQQVAKTLVLGCRLFTPENVAAGGEAIGVLALDSRPPAEAMAEVNDMDTVQRAWIVQLPPAGKMPTWMGR